MWLKCIHGHGCRFDCCDVLEREDRAHFSREVFGEVSDLIVDVLKKGHGCPSTLLLNGGVLGSLEFEGHGPSGSEGVDTD